MSQQRFQDRPIDESTGVNPQHFDADGYVVGQPHHDTVANEDLTPEGTLAPPPGDPNAPVPGPEGAPPEPDLTPPEPNFTPPEPNPTLPDEPPPFAPDEADQAGHVPRTAGGEAN